MDFLFPLIIGVLAALPIIFIVRSFFPSKDHAFWRIGLVVAAVVYVIFVLLSESMTHLPMELGGVAIYSIFAWLSKKYTLHWLAAGWALHICWDVFLHSEHLTPYVPAGYAVSCIGFDIAIAGYIGWLIWKRRKS